MFVNRKLCHVCLEKERIQDKFICEACLAFQEPVHKKLDLEIPGIDEVYVSTLYNSYMRELIRDFKFHDKAYLYRVLGDIMVDSILKNDLNTVDALVYVPMHRVKEAKRGYNQSELLARRISEKTGISVEKRLLKKIKKTRPQSSLEALERNKNLVNSFAINDKIDFENKNILLIDDILTTGKTMEECARVLKKCPGLNIIGLTLSTVSVER